MLLDTPIEHVVRVPYTTAPNMIRNTGAVFNTDPDIYYLKQKHLELLAYNTDLYATTVECQQQKLISAAAEYCGVKTDSIVDLAKTLEEDIAIMSNGQLQAICFCFPSSWIPSERIGQALTDIHTPVADGEKLRAMSQRIAETMADTTQGSFRRWVWTITNSGELSQHPNRKSSAVPKTIDDLYFRMETQTTAPLGDGVSSLFFVRVETCPLSEIWNDPIKKQRILDSTNSMTDAVLDYKNLHHIKILLNTLGE